MSVYNDSAFLQTSIESILNQTYADFEFIIVDDGSTDGSTEILKGYAEYDDRIILLHQKNNKGLTCALNNALGHVNGEYVARMDGDDIALPERLSTQMKFMEDIPDCVCSGTNVLFIDEDGEPINCSAQAADHEDILKQLFQGRGGSIFHPTSIIKTEALTAIDRYDERYRVGQDLDLFLRLSDIGTLANCDQVCLKFRRYTKSATSFEPNTLGVQRRKEIISNALKRKNMENVPPEKIEINEYWNHQSKNEFHSSVAKCSTIAGFPKTSLKHLFIAFKAAPLEWNNYKALLYCVLHTVPGLANIYYIVRAFHRAALSLFHRPNI